MVFCYKVLSFFIIHQDLSFGGFALKIEFVVFVYELINYLFMKLLFLLLGYVMKKDRVAPQNTHAQHTTLLLLLLQPSTPTASQLSGQLVTTEIRTMHKNKF